MLICLVIARPIITPLHVQGSLQLFPASQAAKLLLSVTTMKNVSLQYNVSNGTVRYGTVVKWCNNKPQYSCDKFSTAGLYLFISQFKLHAKDR